MTYLSFGHNYFFTSREAKLITLCTVLVLFFLLLFFFGDLQKQTNGRTNVQTGDATFSQEMLGAIQAAQCAVVELIARGGDEDKNKNSSSSSSNNNAEMESGRELLRRQHLRIQELEKRLLQGGGGGGGTGVMRQAEQLSSSKNAGEHSNSQKVQRENNVRGGGGGVMGNGGSSTDNGRGAGNDGGEIPPRQWRITI